MPFVAPVVALTAMGLARDWISGRALWAVTAVGLLLGVGMATQGPWASRLPVMLWPCVVLTGVALGNEFVRERRREELEREISPESGQKNRAA